MTLWINIKKPINKIDMIHLTKTEEIDLTISRTIESIIKIGNTTPKLRPMIKRLTVEFKKMSESGYLIDDNIVTNNDIIAVHLKKSNIKCTLLIPFFFPFRGPRIIGLELNDTDETAEMNETNPTQTNPTQTNPTQANLFEHYYNSSDFYNPTIKIVNILDIIISKSNTTFEKYNSYKLDETQSLIIGASPGENRTDRTFYTHLNITLLDQLKETIPSDFLNPEERFINVDFLSLDQLQSVSSLPINQKRFQTICFDWSVWKFFINGNCLITNTDVERLNCLYQMLSDDGVLIISSPLDAPIYMWRNAHTLMTQTDEERKIHKEKVQITYSTNIMNLLMRSLFKFKVVKSNIITNELFVSGPDTHPYAHKYELQLDGTKIDRPYDVLICSK